MSDVSSSEEAFFLCSQIPINDETPEAILNPIHNVRGKVILPSLGKDFFTPDGKQFFTRVGKQFFTSLGKQNF